MHEYRDYSTYFFSAIDGFKRNGHQQVKNADIDKDQTISPYEAHLYALKTAESFDLPRSTSEMYLERWCPWYLRWFTFFDSDKNIYNTLSTDIARQHGVFSEKGIDIPMIRRQLKMLNNEEKKLRQNARRMKKEIDSIQKLIRMAMEERFSGLADPYTYNFHKLMSEDRHVISDSIRNHSKYSRLVQKQDDITNNVEAGVTVRRKITTMEKILRLRQLSRLLTLFKKKASKREKDEYMQLLDCEQQPFTQF